MIAIAVVVVAALILVGSLVYWLGEGSPGTPDDFRRSVEATGLTVVWSNSGPRGGDGVVDTECGAVEVTVNRLDDQLWIQWAENSEPLTSDVIEAIRTCTR